MKLSPAWRERGVLALWWAIFAAVAAALQLLQPAPFDSDTGYHIAVARLLREHGILRAFPWTPWSWLADHYADKELLFHVLILPFSSLDPTTAARITGTITGTLVLGTMSSILRAEGSRHAGLWALFALACSGAFAHRFALVRPHVPAIALTLWITWAASRRRLGHLAIASFLFPLAYIAWHQALGLVVVALLADRLAGRPLAWKPAAVAVAALAAGVLVHPNFPNTVRYLWVVNVDILLSHAWGSEAGFEMGGEFRPLGLVSTLRFLAIPILTAAAAAVIAFRKRKDDPTLVAFAIATLGYLAITLRTQRFLEYFVPFAAVSGGLAARHVARAWASPAALGAAAAFTALFGRRPIERLSERVDLFAPNVVAALQQVIPPEQKVFTCDWEFTGEMMLALPGRTFMIAVDPVLFWKKDPERYRAWFSMTRSPPPQPSALVRETFGTRYVMCPISNAKWGAFVSALDEDPSARRLGQIGVWAVFDLARPKRAKPPEPPPAPPP